LKKSFIRIELRPSLRCAARICDRTPTTVSCRQTTVQTALFSAAQGSCQEKINRFHNQTSLYFKGY